MFKTDLSAFETMGWGQGEDKKVYIQKVNK